MSVTFSRSILAMVFAVGLLPSTAQVPAKGGHTHPANPEYGARSAFVPAPRGWDTVKAALSQFDYALAMHDVVMLQAAGVDPAGAKRWDKFFSENPLAKVTDDCPASELFAGETKAFWNCTETVTLFPDGKAQPFYHLIQFSFGKKNGMWKVSGRRSVGDPGGQPFGGPAGWP